jgi:hypothetical protein
MVIQHFLPSPMSQLLAAFNDPVIILYLVIGVLATIAFVVLMKFTEPEQPLPSKSRRRVKHQP